MPPIHDNNSEGNDLDEVEEGGFDEVDKTENDQSSVKGDNEHEADDLGEDTDKDKSRIKDGHVKETVEKFEGMANETDGAKTPVDMKFSELKEESDDEVNESEVRPSSPEQGKISVNSQVFL